MSDNREIVLEALLLHDKGEYADKIIKSILDKYSYLERFERSFINRVFTGTIERKLSLDFVINTFSSVKINKQKPVIRAILRMSVYQILYMDAVPDSAAINEAVKLAKKKKFQGLSGFVNGVLRNISREKDNIVWPENPFKEKFSNIVLDCGEKDADADYLTTDRENATGFNYSPKKVGNDVHLDYTADEMKKYIRYLSVRYSAPEWLCEHFVNETDIKTAEVILDNSLRERPVIIRANISKVTTDELIKLLESEGVTVRRVYDNEDSGTGSEFIKKETDIDGETSRIEFADALIIDDFDGLTSLDSFNDGLFCVQDLSSQRVFEPWMEAETGTCNEQVDTHRSKTDDAINKNAELFKNAKLIIDVCAAPGGKTCHAADLLLKNGNSECKVISRDLTDTKADRIDENVDRCGFSNVSVEVWDALDSDEKLTSKADLVIADLPCSGLGVIGRKADIKYRVSQDDLTELPKLQREILKVVSEYVKPGGMLIFSTCTVNRSENIDNVSWIQENLPFELAGEPLQLYNDREIQDGFFISRFVRKQDSEG